jgi:hypothetical protein
MRKRYRVLLLATIVAAVAGRFGYALSVDPATTNPVAMYARTTVATPAASTIVAPVLVHSSNATPASAPSMIDPLPGAGKLLLVGSFLFGLSAIVRKAI